MDIWHKKDEVVDAETGESVDADGLGAYRGCLVGVIYAVILAIAGYIGIMMVVGGK